MRPTKNDTLAKLSFAIFLFILTFVFPNTAQALELSVEPSAPKIVPNDTLQVDIYAGDALALISMGVKVSFDSALLTVVSAAKHKSLVDGWILDADGDPATTTDQYTNPTPAIDSVNGSVILLGGRIIGTTTAGLSGKVLLGSIVFKALQIGTASIAVDLAYYHPQHPAKTFDNFVNIDGTVDEPTNLGNLAAITVIKDTDKDGISDAIENSVQCLDANDADTDDDGIIDGNEDKDHDGILGITDNETDPCDHDTDNDSILDGTEIGLTKPQNSIATDLSKNFFAPDADPSTHTDPKKTDTDGDGLLDGEEDLNVNGRIDEGESDPNQGAVRALPFVPLLLLN